VESGQFPTHIAVGVPPGISILVGALGDGETASSRGFYKESDEDEMVRRNVARRREQDATPD
jgi:hypothetical protein